MSKYADIPSVVPIADNLSAVEDYISREDAIEAVEHDEFYTLRNLESLPSADVVERNRGEWYSHSMTMHSCPFCGKMVSEKSKYCADCGAELI